MGLELGKLFGKRTEKPKPTPLEIQRAFERFYGEHPLTNRDIWLIIVAQAGSLTVTEINDIAFIYGANCQYKDISVAELIQVSDIPKVKKANLTSSRFLRSVCFNYDSTFHAEEEWYKA